MPQTVKVRTSPCLPPPALRKSFGVDGLSGRACVRGVIAGAVTFLLDSMQRIGAWGCRAMRWTEWARERRACEEPPLEGRGRIAFWDLLKAWMLELMEGLWDLRLLREWRKVASWRKLGVMASAMKVAQVLKTLARLADSLFAARELKSLGRLVRLAWYARGNVLLPHWHPHYDQSELCL